MPLWLADRPLVLASQSAIRHTILRDAGIPVEVEAAGIDERAVEQGLASRDAGEVAAVLAREGVVVFEHREVARLTMRAFTDDFLESYLDLMGATVVTSVGGYQLEKAGIQLFERVEGDHFVILGLPLLALLRYLRGAGLLAA
jgi:nucleoside triphosphate pyrophosphatase